MERYLEQLDESAHLVNANLFRAAELIADFKKVSVLSSNEEKSEFEVGKVIKETLNTLQPILMDNQIEVRLKLKTKINLFKDPANLIQTINNLVLNSIHHGFNQDSQEKQILISIRQKQGKLTILYRDNGKGISEEVKQHIFEPFYTTKRNNGGTGLGMHIVYNMVTQGLGGQIEVGNVASGAEFMITVPLGE